MAFADDICCLFVWVKHVEKYERQTGAVMKHQCMGKLDDQSADVTHVGSRNALKQHTHTHGLLLCGGGQVFVHNPSQSPRMDSAKHYAEYFTHNDYTRPYPGAGGSDEKAAYENVCAFV